MTTLITKLAENNANNWVRVNEAIDGTQDSVDVSVAAGGTITIAADDFRLNHLIRLTGAPGAPFTFKLGTGERVSAIENASGKTATIDSVAGSTIKPTLLTGWAQVYAQRASGEITQVAPPYPVSRAKKRVLWIGAEEMQAKVTAGCGAIASREVSAGSPDVGPYRTFDNTTEQHAQFAFDFPPSWNAGMVTFAAHDVHSGAQGAGLDGRVWGLRALAVGTTEAIAGTYGAEVTVTIDNATANVELISAESAAVTIGGTPSKTKRKVFFELSRKTGNAADDFDGAALMQLLGITLYFTTDAESDD